MTDDHDPAAEFAALLSDQPPSEPADSIYDGLDEADQFTLAVHLASGGTLGVPDNYDPDTPDPDAPRRQKPDMSQGRGRDTPATADPWRVFAQLADDIQPGPR